MGLFKNIDAAKTSELVSVKDAIFVDIRDPEAFKAGHIERAILINDSNVGEFLKEADKSKPLICYCYHGINSQSAAEYFAKQGFREVYSLEGGFEKWKTAYPFVEPH